MGQLEKEARSERRKGYLQQAVLGTVAVAGVIAIAMVAPNLLQLSGGFSRNRNRFSEYTHSAATRLANRGFVTFEQKNGKKYLRITEAGRRFLLQEELKFSLRNAGKKRWDRRWRMVVFDIPERRRGVRGRLRQTMRSLGFLRLQHSVWIYPYDCEDLLTLLKADLHVGKDVVYAIVERIENDAWIKRHFGIKH